VSGPFRGFPVEGLDFYDDLEADNSRSFWVKNKQTYLDAVRAPMEALLSELEPDFGPGKAFRPYRDLRYSNDPTPYKTHQGGFVATGEACGFYVQVDAAGLLTGAGWYHAAGPAVAHFRAPSWHESSAGSCAPASRSVATSSRRGRAAMTPPTRASSCSGTAA
jgi:uncharacterized protein (DUF2461 family)